LDTGDRVISYESRICGVVAREIGGKRWREASVGKAPIRRLAFPGEEIEAAYQRRRPQDQPQYHAVRDKQGKQEEGETGEDKKERFLSTLGMTAKAG
jgi:hypothetical protein